MKIYILIDEEDPEYRAIHCLSEDIQLIYKCYLQVEERLQDYFSFEIWEDGECLDYACTKDTVLQKIVRIINEKGGIKDEEVHNTTENQ